MSGRDSMVRGAFRVIGGGTVLYLLILIYLGTASLWTVLPFLAWRQKRFVTQLLVAHLAGGAVVALSASFAAGVGAGLGLLFCFAPGSTISLLFVFLRTAFPDKPERPPDTP